MKQFELSQMVVQRKLQSLQERGLVVSQVGRGTFVRASIVGSDPSSKPREVPASNESRTSSTRTVLLLRRSISITRGRFLIEKLHERLTKHGCKVLEVTYSDSAHAKAVLAGLPYFDACVIQSSFNAIPIELLACIRAKTDVLAVDGLALIGTEVEAVGTEWGEPLALAVARMHSLGHRQIAFAATTQPILATQLGWRRLDHLRKTYPDSALIALPVAQLPHEDYAAHLCQELHHILSANGGKLPFSALITWGVEDGAHFRELLANMRLASPEMLSVVLLGRTDLSNEHDNFFETVGCSVEDQSNTLFDAIIKRWDQPGMAHGTHLTPVTTRQGGSVRAKPASLD